MRVIVKPKLLAIPSVFSLSDLHLVAGDLVVARRNFTETIGKPRIVSPGDISSYTYCCSGLIHYRRACTSGRRISLLNDDVVKAIAPDFLEIHQFLWNLASKYVAHSVNEFEHLLAAVYVAEGEDGISRFHSIGQQGSANELLSEDQVAQSISLINTIVSDFVEPQIDRLKIVITEYCAKLSPEELKMLPDGFAPEGSRDPVKNRVWPHSGKC